MTTIAETLVRPATEEDGYLPEGPRTIIVQGRPMLIWVNIQRAPDLKTGSIHLRDWETGHSRSIRLHARPGFVFPTDRANVVLVGCEKEIGLLNLVDESWRSLAKIPDPRPETIINDGEIEPGGQAIVFGTKDVRFQEPIAHLYRMTLRDAAIHTVADQQLCSNGKVLSRDDRGPILYDIDTPKKRVDRYRMIDGKWKADGIALDLATEAAFPDGMVDAGDDSVIIAFFNPHRGGDGVARRYCVNDGSILEEWCTPGSPRVTCPLLVERDGKIRLVLTTAVEGMSQEMRANSPNAGCLFIADTSLMTMPPSEIARLS